MRRLFMVLIVTIIFSAGMIAQARDRDLTKIDPGKHTVTELWNAQVQAVIDTSWPYRTLDSLAVDTGRWIALEALSKGYPSLMNYVIRLDSGKVEVWFEEYYWSAIPAARHPDSTHVLWSGTAPLETAGQWVKTLPFYGGQKLRRFVRACASHTGFQDGFQSMRQ